MGDSGKEQADLFVKASQHLKYPGNTHVRLSLAFISVAFGGAACALAKSDAVSSGPQTLAEGISLWLVLYLGNTGVTRCASRL